jgi:hypothetical protein
LSNPELITLGIGIAVSMIYAWRTGLGSGGLVSAGLLALSWRAPMRIFFCLAVAFILCPVLNWLVRRYGLHGRTRIGWAMLLALALRLLAGFLIRPVPWIGWVVPALLAADMQRQGMLETVSSILSVTCLTALLAQLVFQLGSVVQ